jgi:hypothetical protein
MDGTEEFGGRVEQSAFCYLHIETNLTISPGQETSGGLGTDHGWLNVDEELKAFGHPMSNGVVNGGIAARFVEFGKPSFSGGPPKRRRGINSQVWPPGQSFRCDLLMAEEIENWLVLGLQVAPVKQFIECERLHRSWIPPRNRDPVAGECHARFT